MWFGLNAAIFSGRIFHQSVWFGCFLLKYLFLIDTSKFYEVYDFSKTKKYEVLLFEKEWRRNEKHIKKNYEKSNCSKSDKIQRFMFVFRSIIKVQKFCFFLYWENASLWICILRRRSHEHCFSVLFVCTISEWAHFSHFSLLPSLFVVGLPTNTHLAKVRFLKERWCDLKKRKMTPHTILPGIKHSVMIWEECQIGCNVILSTMMITITIWIIWTWHMNGWRTGCGKCLCLWLNML